MATTRYTSGGVTITLDGALEAFARRAADAAIAGTLQVLEAAAEEEAGRARAAWYTQVDRETGESGDIQAITTIDEGKGEVRVSVGSTDTRKDKRGKVAAWFVHRPVSTSLVKQQVTHEEYYATPKPLRANYKPLPGRNGVKGDPPGSGPFIWVLNPRASDGKYLLQELVRKPVKARLKQLTPALGRAIAARMNGGRHG